MSEFSTQFSYAVQLARSGEREQARQILWHIIERSPEDTDAWLWLSELTDGLDDQVAALENAERYAACEDGSPLPLQERLNAIRGSLALAMPPPVSSSVLQETAVSAQPSSPAEMYQQAERLSLLGSGAQAADLLAELLEKEPCHPSALRLLSELSPDPAEKVRLLERRTACTPRDNAAERLMIGLRPLQHDWLLAGQYLEENGEPEQALSLYRAAAAQLAGEAQRAEANRRIPGLEVRLGIKPSTSGPAKPGLRKSLIGRLQVLTSWLKTE